MSENPAALVIDPQLQYQAFDSSQRPDAGDAAAWSDRALELSRDCAPAFLVKALLAHMTGDMAAAIALGHQALELGGGAETRFWLSYFYLQAGRFEEAREAAAAAMVRDPLAWEPRWAGAAIAMMDGDLAGAIHQMRASLDVGGEQACVRFWMAMCLEYAGRTQEAIAVCEEMRAWGGQFTQVADVWIARLAGNRDAAVVTFRSSLLLATASVQKELAWWTADTFARLGDFDAALSQLATAIDLGIWNSRFWSSVDPAFAPLRGDPRFAALIDRAKEMERR